MPPLAQDTRRGVAERYRVCLSHISGDAQAGKVVVELKSAVDKGVIVKVRKIWFATAASQWRVRVSDSAVSSPTAAPANGDYNVPLNVRSNGPAPLAGFTLLHPTSNLKDPPTIGVNVLQFSSAASAALGAADVSPNDPLDSTSEVILDGEGHCLHFIPLNQPAGLIGALEWEEIQLGSWTTRF